MKKLTILVTLMFFLVSAFAQQRVVAECTVVYNITLDDNSVDTETAATLKATTKTVYIKGVNSRTDLISPSFSQSVIYNKNTASATILRSIGANKFMTKLDQAKWISEHTRYVNMKLIKSDETKVILGYECKKLLLELTDGTFLTVFYAANIAPSVKEFEYQFKDVPGFVLEYEATEGEGKKIKYTAAQINFNPVAASRFDIPTTGYRILNN
jgi:GLPGLI family protein